MRHVCCEIFPKKIVPKFVCPMVKFSMPAMLDWILHLASQTMYFGVSYFVRYFDKTPKICCYVSLQAILFLKIVLYNLNQ